MCVGELFWVLQIPYNKYFAMFCHFAIGKNGKIANLPFLLSFAIFATFCYILPFLLYFVIFATFIFFVAVIYVINPGEKFNSSSSQSYFQFRYGGQLLNNFSSEEKRSILNSSFMRLNVAGSDSYNGPSVSI